MERRETNYLRSIFLSGLGFGIGGVIGNFALFLLVRSQILEWPLNLVPEDQSLVRLVTAIVLLIIGIALSTGVGGAVGGYILGLVDPIFPRRKYIWRTAISSGVAEGILILPLLLLIVILALYNNGLDRDPVGYVIVFGIFGILFGLLFGFLIGFLTIEWRQVWRILLASMVGFGLGGAAIGYGIRIAYYPATLGGDLPSFSIIFPILTFIFFGIGGLFLGWVYEWVNHWRVDNVPDEPSRWVKVAGVLAGLLLIFLVVSNYRQLIKFLTIQPASVSSQININSFGVHWQDDQIVSNQLIQSDDYSYSASASFNGQVGAAWTEYVDGVSTVFLSTALDSDTGEFNWSDKYLISNNLNQNAVHPQVFVDGQGRHHIVWVERREENSDVLYRTCLNGQCTEPIVLSIQSGQNCEGVNTDSQTASFDWPVVSTAADEKVMVMWSNAANQLFYANWDLDQGPSVSYSCSQLPIISGSAISQIQPRLSGNSDGSFSAVFSVEESGEAIVYKMDHLGETWSTPESLGEGGQPNVFSSPDGSTYFTWCDGEEFVRVKNAQTELVDIIEFPSCRSRPSMSLSGNGELHLAWHSDEIRNNLNVVSQANIVYESILTTRGWSEPAIVVETAGNSMPIITGGGKSDLMMLWDEDPGGSLKSARQPVYQCSGDDLGDIGQVILETIKSGNYRVDNDEIPFCNNRYLELIYMPNPEPEYSSQAPSPNGGFDKLSDLASVVEYELDISNMEWAPDEGDQRLNPGSVFIGEIAQLYQQIQENPARYPRGITVRILLGNYPELAKLEWGEQIWNVISDLRNAGVDKMVDSNIGWKVELANYDGVYPHSHTKYMVIDGKIAVGAGFNFGYLHFPFDHPSQKGGDLYDLGLVATGPIAQQVLATFDDYWEGADQLHCPDLSPDPGYLWTRSCTRNEAQVYHVPEVQKYYLPEDSGELSNAFSLNRNINFKESDDVILAVLSSAEKSLDILEVNFSLELICALDLLNDEVCDFENALDYMKAILASVDQNQTRVRVLVEKINSNGMENRISAKEFTRELERRGLDQFVEIRFFEGRMHAKAFLVDGEMLFVGSQNFHYSAWGDGGLAEYNLATDDPTAVETFKKLFDYYWEVGIPWEEYK